MTHHGQQLHLPIVKILEEPAAKALRFRYECEGRSAGSLPGATSTHEKKTFPRIQVRLLIFFLVFSFHNNYPPSLSSLFRCSPPPLKILPTFTHPSPKAWWWSPAWQWSPPTAPTPTTSWERRAAKKACARWSSQLQRVEKWSRSSLIWGSSAWRKRTSRRVSGSGRRSGWIPSGVS